MPYDIKRLEQMAKGATKQTTFPMPGSKGVGGYDLEKLWRMTYPWKEDQGAAQPPDPTVRTVPPGSSTKSQSLQPRDVKKAGAGAMPARTFGDEGGGMITTVEQYNAIQRRVRAEQAEIAAERERKRLEVADAQAEHGGMITTVEQYNATQRRVRAEQAEIAAERERKRLKVADAPTAAQRGRVMGDIGKGIVTHNMQSPYGLHPPNGATVFGITDKSLGRIKNGKPVGDWILRFDKPHTRYKFPHYNINPTQAENIGYKPDPVSGKLPDHIKLPVGGLGLAKLSDPVARVVKTGGKALALFGVALDGYELGSTIYNDLNDDDKQLGKETLRVSVGIGGSYAGAWGAAKVGAIGGAALGNWMFPGIGTVFGGILGGISGGISGAIGGRKLGEYLVDTAYTEAYRDPPIYRGDILSKEDVERILAARPTKPPTSWPWDIEQEVGRGMINTVAQYDAEKRRLEAERAEIAREWNRKRGKNKQ